MKVIPNAIQIVTGSGKTHFASFVNRDKVFSILLNNWQASHIGSDSNTPHRSANNTSAQQGSPNNSRGSPSNSGGSTSNSGSSINTLSTDEEQNQLPASSTTLRGEHSQRKQKKRQKNRKKRTPSRLLLNKKGTLTKEDRTWLLKFGSALVCLLIFIMFLYIQLANLEDQLFNWTDKQNLILQQMDQVWQNISQTSRIGLLKQSMEQCEQEIAKLVVDQQ
eukprot:CAMPEP_0201561542 /NCGR_PEP_ID=MMETSP0173_2-20130828/78852_1 /ASSEMBLY_ACC=CAM_ASM_000268 /TAXON_ID=218659 /ORGANISM="Vexillifera sp., Strain DIVA3 564/2" /LENGTH=219 /DNA_ID=CAMNT_0047976053 /DNA_START=100 /DNA_END=759 /DNA_ORIENTATION=-